MSKDYDDDDYSNHDYTEDFDTFEVGSEDMDIFDFDSSLDDLLIALEADIADATLSIAMALQKGEDRDRIDRLEDELALLEMELQHYT
jgi:uncharacterized Zn finger protein